LPAAFLQGGIESGLGDFIAATLARVHAHRRNPLGQISVALALDPEHGSVPSDRTAPCWQSLLPRPRQDQPASIIQAIKPNVSRPGCAGIARQEWVYIAPSIAADFELLQERLSGFEFSIQSQTDDDRRWIVEAHKAEQPATYFLLDRDKQSLIELFRARPALAPYRLAPMHAVQTKSRDGLDLVSYLTLPADINADRPPDPLPMVLVVHGGPWSRDSYGYRADHQWLADRGYAVLSVNYRGSTGFGKAFIAASEKQHAAKMHDDLNIHDFPPGRGARSMLEAVRARERHIEIHWLLKAMATHQQIPPTFDDRLPEELLDDMQGERLRIGDAFHP
jgi:acetyl esterase/lipase